MVYKTAVPIALDSMRDDYLEQDLQRYLNYFKEGNIQRVFISILTGMYSEEFTKDIYSEKLKKTVDFFKSQNLETGVWINSFGHGMALEHEDEIVPKCNYQKITGVMGEAYDYGYCPLDDNFVADYIKHVKKIASLNPDMIMFDDDFRLNGRRYHLGCFCEKHLKEFYRIIGKEIPRNEIEKLAFSGKGNKYRDAYMEMSKNTLLNFAKKLRKAVDEINPNIRIGNCTSPFIWDFEGNDVVELAKNISGSLRPFLRTFAAPYGNQYNIIDVVELSRMEHNYIKRKNREIEIFSEGDVYPRPRYNVSSKALELYDLALCCEGKSDGILKYIFDYTLPVGYETGYIERHIKIQNIQSQVRKLFEDKTSTGVSIFTEIHKTKDWVLPETNEEKPSRKIFDIKVPSDLISQNSIPSCHGISEYPVIVSSENARHIPVEQLKNGAVLDSTAAKILKERGIDTGLISVEDITGIKAEYYIDFKAAVTGIGTGVFSKIVCDKKAKVLSTLLPNESVGTYLYENKDGIRFMVFAADFYFSPSNANYYNNYYRQNQLISSIEWLGNKPLPAISKKHPNLYIMTAKNEKAMSVLLINIFMDDIDDPIITLDKAYKSIKFVNCNGYIKNNNVYLSDVPPYGFAAFEVSEN